MKLSPNREEKINRSAYGILVVSGLCFAADLSIWHWSIHHTSIANSTLLTNLAPVFIVLGAWLFLGEKASRFLLASIAVAVAGAALLVIESLSSSQRNILGDSTALIAAIFYAGYIVAMKRARGEVSTPAAMFWSGVASAPAMAAAGLFAGEDFSPETPRGWLVLAALALVSHVGGQGLIAAGLAHLPASFSGVTLLWQPVVAAVLAAMFLGERITTVQLAGGVVVLLGIYLAQRSLKPGKTR